MMWEVSFFVVSVMVVFVGICAVYQVAFHVGFHMGVSEGVQNWKDGFDSGQAVGDSCEYSLSVDDTMKVEPVAATKGPSDDGDF